MSRWTSTSRRLLGLAFWACALSVAAPAGADTLIIRSPGDHSRYRFEAEPHLLLGLINPPGVGSGTGLGVGFRGTIVLVDNGFVPTINNSVGIGFGLDWLHYGHGRSHCIVDNGPTMGCYGQDNSESVNNIWLPVVMQWNFFLSRHWSVFGEPGVALRYQSLTGDHAFFVDPQCFVGGRWHFSDEMTLTLRLGYPSFSAGVSFM
jgi:hypothetical protein